MTNHEAVLRDLLLECGVEGVTLWHIRCLAAALGSGLDPYLRSQRTMFRLNSDLRGEEAVLAEAHADAEVHASFSAPCNCAQCRAFARALGSELAAQPAAGSA